MFKELLKSKENLAKNIRITREKKCLTKNALAEKVGIHHTTYSNIEDRTEFMNHSIFNIAKIAEALNTTLDELFYGKKNTEDMDLYYKVKRLKGKKRDIVKYIVSSSI